MEGCGHGGGGYPECIFTWSTRFANLMCDLLGVLTHDLSNKVEKVILRINNTKCLGYLFLFLFFMLTPVNNEMDSADLV